MSSTRIGIGFIISAVLVTMAAAQPEPVTMTSGTCIGRQLALC